ncbi:hypothetical protein Nepgr_015091 [Nepenthes gracilis]|uniref:Uncharacterized protein n=1 Tax=Nepenthes gracilis TaxID=150966 RepID=A0AAD3SKG5_NEPGR|nr:hypothetical protein Nepgr_015091 [Nepenthes gracilis]
MDGCSVEDLGAAESREATDVEERMKRLMLSPATATKKEFAASSIWSSSSASSSGNTPVPEPGADASSAGSVNLRSSSSAGAEKGALEGLSEEAIHQVDQFLREALQNPRERLSILRLEQDIEKFICDPTQHQLEFQKLPTSYLRLAAHRVAQHYFLQSMVLLDNNLPDGSGSKIVVHKNSAECQLPRIRLADVPVNLPQEDGGGKVAIKQRLLKRSPVINNSNSYSAQNQSKSVEERKEEYNKARARIFNSNNRNGTSCVKPENELRMDTFQLGSVGISKLEEKSVLGGSDLSTGRGILNSSTSSGRSGRSRTEKEPVVKCKPNNRVAIFRDRDVDRKDPDYDRSYERYMHRFDPRFGFNTVPYAVQPMYNSAVNYNMEVQQPSSTCRPQVSAEHQPRLPQHVPGPWASLSNPPGIGYGHPEPIMTAFTPNQVSGQSSSALYLHSPQYPCQLPGMQFVYPHERIHLLYSQQHDATLGLARPPVHFGWQVCRHRKLRQAAGTLFVQKKYKCSDFICTHTPIFYAMGLYTQISLSCPGRTKLQTLLVTLTTWRNFLSIVSMWPTKCIFSSNAQGSTQTFLVYIESPMTSWRNSRPSRKGQHQVMIHDSIPMNSGSLQSYTVNSYVVSVF